MERFWSKVDVGLCWEWMAGTGSEGYGQFRLDGRMQKAHRVAWELLVGVIPDGLVIDHLCRNRRCVNPDHLEPVTSAENVRRGVGGRNGGRVRGANQSAKTNCPRGHPYEGRNLIVSRKGHRFCRQCGLIRQAEYHQRRRFL